MSTDVKPKAGLEDVVAGTSAICFLDGDRGVLAYQGYDIHELADAERGVSFEEVCFLLWQGRLPNRAELGDLQWIVETLALFNVKGERRAARARHPCPG